MNPREGLRGAERDVALRPHVKLKLLLFSRRDPGRGKDTYSEDVQVYLDHLEKSMTGDITVEESKNLSRFDTDLADLLYQVRYGRIRYLVFRTANDLLVISFGTFYGVDEIPNTLDRPVVKSDEEAFIGRGRHYYRYCYQLSGVLSDMSALWEKMQASYNTYVRLLANMRGVIDESDCEVMFFSKEYDRIQEESERLEREAIEEAIGPTTAMDRWLDALHPWVLAGRPPEGTEALLILAREIKEEVPNFTVPDLTPQKPVVEEPKTADEVREEVADPTKDSVRSRTEE